MVLTLEGWGVLKKPPSDPQLSLVISGESPSMQSCTYPELKLQQALPGHGETGYQLVSSFRDREGQGNLWAAVPTPAMSPTLEPSSLPNPPSLEPETHR